MSTDVKAGVVYFDRQTASGVPKIGFRQDYGSKANQGLAGINVDSSGQLILLDKAGVTQATVTTAGVTFPNSGQSMNYATGTFGLGSESTTNVLTITLNTALTTGVLFGVSSSATAITGAGRLFFSNHTGATGTSAILNEFKSAANDETVILQVTATAALAAGAALNVSAVSMTTGAAFQCTDNTSLTTGILLSVASSATAIATTGRLIYSNHSGATGTSAILNEFVTSANDETNLFKLTASSLTTGAVLTIAAAGITTGNLIAATDNSALTSGILVSIASSATAITGAGRLFLSNHTGATGTSAILNEFKSAANDETIILQVTATTVLAAGIALKISTASATTATLVSILGAALTTGAAISCVDNTALTTGQLITIASSATAIATTGRLFLSYHSGATGTSATLNEFKSDATDETIILGVTATAALAAGVALNMTLSSMTTGIAIKVLAAAVTTGSVLLATDNTALTTGILVSIATSATAITGAGRLFFSNHTGATGTSATLNEFKSAANDETIIVAITATAALATGVALNMTLSSMTTGIAVKVLAAAITTGSVLTATDNTAVTTGNLVSIASSSTAISTGRLLYSNFTGATSSAGTTVLNEFAAGSVTDGTTLAKFTCAGTGIQVNIAHATGVLASGKAALQVTSSAANATGSAILLVSGTGTPAGATSYLAKFDYSGMTATNNPVAVFITQIGTAAALSITTSGAVAAGAGVLTVAQTGTPTSTGYLAKFDNSGITATNNPPGIFINQKGTGAAIAVTAVVQSTHFYKIGTFNGVTLWVGDGNTGNSALSATAGDILFNGGSNKPEYCTGTNAWTALV